MNENRAKQEYYEKQSKSNSSRGRGTRTSTIGGDELKAKLKSGAINI